MPSYQTPGVYIEEISSGLRPIQAVPTSIAAFIGLAPDGAVRVGEAVRIEDWSSFARIFVRDKTATTHLANAVYGFLTNGGSTCYVVNLGAAANLTQALNELERIDEIAIVAAPGFTDAITHDAVLTHCERLRDRVAVLDAPAKVAEIASLTQVALVEAKKKDAAKDAADPTAAKDKKGGARSRISPGGFGALYYPWIVAKDPVKGEVVEMPPSGHVAGIYARTDVTRGVHKAPANEVIRGAVGVSHRVTREEQGTLNPAGVNCIRYFGQTGVRVWGARTLDEAASEYRYVPVRRFVCMVSESLEEALQWMVFETNHEPLWKAIRRDITAFLPLLWRQGMLKGETPEQAFFVKCDAETNPEDVIAAGQVVTIIDL
ncbi:MAG TPA: phage tail sheath subtilisin-like domain-containing protein, partial [Planctomycetota bacterium]|nr:phage tail sheath subtilisin-like domain-containing protein [Planctomycetota bacterium]